MIEALRNENRFLQEEVDRYRMQNKELIELIFKLRKKNGIIRKSRFSPNPKRSVRILGFCIKRSVQKNSERTT